MTPLGTAKKEFSNKTYSKLNIMSQRIQFYQYNNKKEQGDTLNSDSYRRS